MFGIGGAAGGVGFGIFFGFGSGIGGGLVGRGLCHLFLDGAPAATGIATAGRG